MNESLNTSKKSMYCNHCMYDCESYENMKVHYKSEFHRYNLNRVTMHLNPLTIEEYTKKKENYQKLHQKQKSDKEKSEIPSSNLSCEICSKSFCSHNKMKEHMNSKSHKKNEEYAKNNPVQRKVRKASGEEKTTKDDPTYCLFCNSNEGTIDKNIEHMVDSHRLDVPFINCISDKKELINLILRKIFEYNACLSCDSQSFTNYKSLQNHMLDKQHTYINIDDLDEYLYQYYDKKKLNEIKDKSHRKTDEFQILKYKLKLNKHKQEKKEEKGDWVIVEEADVKTKKPAKEESDSEDDDVEPISLPSGELLLVDGTVAGNKIYKTYYKQRVNIKKHEKLANSIREDRINKIKIKKRRMKANHLKEHKHSSNKTLFKRSNQLVNARKQVSV